MPSSQDLNPDAEFATFQEQTRAVLQATLASRAHIRDSFVELRGVPAKIERVANSNQRRDSYGEIRENITYVAPVDICIVLNITNYLTQLDKYASTQTDERDKVPLDGWVKLDEQIRAGDRITIDLQYINDDEEIKMFEVTQVQLQNHLGQISKSVQMTVYRR